MSGSASITGLRFFHDDGLLYVCAEVDGRPHHLRLDPNATARWVAHCPGAKVTPLGAATNLRCDVIADLETLAEKWRLRGKDLEAGAIEDALEALKAKASRVG